MVSAGKVVQGMLLSTLVIALLASAVGCRRQNPDTANSPPVIPTATPTPTPTLRLISDTKPIDVEGQEGRWRVFVQSMDRPVRLPPLRLTPTPDSWRERAEGQFVVVIASVENLGTNVPNVSIDLGSAVVLRDGAGREWTPLRGASAAYTLSLPGAPGSPYEARLQPARAMPYGFVFDVPSTANGLSFGGRSEGPRVTIAQ